MTGVTPAPLFTVVTATYNRGATLHRVYDSLYAQTLRDFEWLIVDDGSTDDTEEQVTQWTLAADFSIRYFHQENKGKHIAFNRAVREAHGALIVVLDSDDACVPHALERFKTHWDGIPSAERERYTGVTALCMDQHGQSIGDLFPIDVFDSDALELRYRYKVRGEKWGFNRTDILRRFPFPEHILRTYVPEDIVWNRIAREYRTRFVNERLRVYWNEGVSMVHGHGAAHNAMGGRLEHLNALTTELDWLRFAPIRFLRSALHYTRYSFHTGAGFIAQWQALKSFPARILWLLMLVPGFMVYTLDKR